MAESRQRLRPWLEGQLNSGTIPGLIWLPNDKGHVDKLKFRIPWKHGGKHDWTPDQGRVWKEWAVHTGKFRPGVDEEAFAKWKTNLRCALNKASDIQEIQEESQREADEPFKVYRFLPRKDKNANHPVHKRQYAAGEVLNYSTRPDVADMSHLPAQVADYTSSMSSRGSSIQSNPFPSGGAGGMGMDLGSIPSDLQGLNSGSLQEMRISSMERERLIKDERMDCDEQTTRDAENALAYEMPSSAVAYAQIKQEQNQPGYSDHSRSSFDQSQSPFSDHSQNGFLNSPGYPNPQQQQQQYVKPMNNTDVFPDQLIDMANHGQNPQFMMTSPAHGGMQCTYLPTVAPSPSNYSVASSPQSQMTAPPSNGTAFMYSPVSSPQQHFRNPSPVASPQQLVGNTPQSSPHSAYTAPSPAMLSPQGGTSDFGSTGVVSQLAGLGMADTTNNHMTTPLNFHNQFTVADIKIDPETDIEHQCPHPQDECSMMVEVKYKNTRISEYHVGKEGCVIACNPITAQQGQILDEAGLKKVKDIVYHLKDGLTTINLPEWQKSGNMKLDREVDNLLKSTSRGIFIECRNGDIYAKRICKTSVYYASHFEEERCRKINRSDEYTKIFDYQGMFEPAVMQFAHDVKINSSAEVNHPNPYVYFFVGQNGTPSNAHTRYVVIKISSCKARKVLKCMEKQLYSVTAEVSKSDSLDILDQNIRKELGVEPQLAQPL